MRGPATAAIAALLVPTLCAAQAAFGGGYIDDVGVTHGVITTVNATGHGLPNPKNSTTFYLGGPDGVGNQLSMEIYSGQAAANQVSPAIVQEVYGGSAGGGLVAVKKGQWTSQWGSAAFDGKGDPTDAILVTMATEDHAPDASNGMGWAFMYTPNGSTGLTTAMAISASGAGGLSVGGSNVGGSGVGAPPADLGNGTVHAGSDIVTDNHFRGKGAAPTSRSCGGTVRFSAGASDNAGQIFTGSACATVQVDFHGRYANAPARIVQVYANASPVAYLSSVSESAFTVSLTSALNGTVTYICMGAG